MSEVGLTDQHASKNVVILDEDRDVAELIQAVLIDEGFVVSCLYRIDEPDVTAAIERLRPDCVIIDGIHLGQEWEGWNVARWLSSRPRPVPVIMLTAQIQAQEEAIVDLSERAKAAAFVSVIPKPFDIDRVISTVRQAVGLDTRASTDAEERARHADLLDRLRGMGAEELQSSAIGREWATFRAGKERFLYKVYRWRSADRYYVGRYSLAGDQLEPLGQFPDLEALIAYCTVEIGRRL